MILEFAHPTPESSSVKESEVEKYLDRQVKEMGGITRKWSSPSHRGVPDRIVMLDKGIVVFVEVKRAQGALSRLQTKELTTLAELGQTVAVVYGKDGVDSLIKCLRAIYASKG